MRVSKEQREALRDVIVDMDNEHCGYALIGADDIEEPCDLPTEGLRWYDHCSHEPMLGAACWHHMDEGGRLIGALVSDLDDAEQRAERAEAELAALRERVRHRAWAFDVPGKRAYAAGLRDLLDDDTTGAASGEGEK